MLRGKEKMSNSKKLLNFYKRWNVPIDITKSVNEFKARTINSIISNLSNKLMNLKVENEYLTLMGKTIIQTSITDELSNSLRTISYKFTDTEVCKILQKEEDFIEYIRCLQTFFWMEALTPDDKEALAKSFQEDISMSFVDIAIKKVRNDYIFHPKGAKLLDELLVDDVLDWLSEYNSAYKSFSSALDKYLTKSDYRNLIDDLRVTLEQFLKEVLKNEKSLENQTSEVGLLLKEKGVSSYLRNMFSTLLSYYIHYQNNNVKHGHKFKDFEIEFLIYLTGSFVRFIITILEEDGESIIE